MEIGIHVIHTWSWRMQLNSSELDLNQFLVIEKHLNIWLKWWKRVLTFVCITEDKTFVKLFAR